MPTISPPIKKIEQAAKIESVKSVAPAESEFTQSSGNIFADLGLPDPEEAKAKALLSLQIESVIKQKRMTQAVAAQKMGLTQPNVSDLMRGRLKGFTIDRLLHSLNALEQDIEIVVRARPEGSGSGNVRVVAMASLPEKAS